MSDDRTIYTIIDEYKESTTITLDKFVADTLQEHLPNVHSWVQSAYNRVSEKKPDIGRRKKGDLVRAISWREAVKFMTESGQLDEL